MAEFNNLMLKKIIITTIQNNNYRLQMLYLHYLPLICCSFKDAIYSVDDGVLNLLSLELVVYVLKMKRIVESLSGVVS